MQEDKILVVEDDKDMANKCQKLFTRSAYNARVCYSAAEALGILNEDSTIRIVLTDLKMPGIDGIELLRRIKARYPHVEVVVMTGYGTIQSAVEAIKLGASDYITKPFNKDELLNVVRKIIETQKLKAEVVQLRSSLQGRFGFDEIIGNSEKMATILKRAFSAAQSDSSILILGESGTGKELVARAIHKASKRAAGPFVPVNCGALPKDLIESELFGHKKGSYTGADSDTLGLFRSAQTGTIFLDEIAEMPNETQVALLRVLQERRIRPVGAAAEIDVDVRVVSATNRKIAEAITDGLLRNDLFYRISVVVIEIPPIRDRVEDIPLLVDAFIRKFNRIFDRQVECADGAALQILSQYSWPGNVRELENLIEGLFAMGIHSRIKASDVREIQRRESPALTIPKDSQPVNSLSAVERQAVVAALEATDGNKSKAALILGISRTRLYKKMELYGLK